MAPFCARSFTCCRSPVLKMVPCFALQVQAINLLQSLEPPEGEAGNAPLPDNTIEPDIRSAVYASAARNGYWVRASLRAGCVCGRRILACLNCRYALQE